MSCDESNACSFSGLEKDIIGSGLCCFCGTCVSACPYDNIAINYADEEPYRISKEACPTSCRFCWNVCPGKALQYPRLEAEIFGRVRADSEWELGIYKSLAAGSASVMKTRKSGTSGGVGTALLQQVLQSKLAVGVVIASTDSVIPWRGIPYYTDKIEDLEKHARSKYVPIPMNAAIKTAARKYGRIAVTALPCQVAGIRKAQSNKIKHFQQIEVIIGIACGYCAHGSLYEHLISEILNVPLEKVKTVEFRGGPYPGEFRAYKMDNSFVSCPSNIRLSMAFSFIRDRCSMCIDWGAELADISLADLYARKENDKTGKLLGNSAIIVRTNKGKNLLRLSEKAGIVRLSYLSKEELSGNIGLEWKKHGFARHLANRKEKGWPVPDFGFMGSVDPWMREMHIYKP